MGGGPTSSCHRRHQQNNRFSKTGLDAIGLEWPGDFRSGWPNATITMPTPHPASPTPCPGYVVANGDLQLVSSKLTVKDGDVCQGEGRRHSSFQQRQP